VSIKNKDPHSYRNLSQNEVDRNMEEIYDHIEERRLRVHAGFLIVIVILIITLFYVGR